MLGGTSPATPPVGNSPLLYTLAFRPNASLETVKINTKKKKQTQGSIRQRGGRKFLGHLIRHNLWQITNIRIVQTGSYKVNKPKICNRKLLSDIWSRSNFWLSNRARFPSADVGGKTIDRTEDSPIYRLNQSLSLQMLALFARSYMTLFEWFWWYLCPKMAYKMPQVFSPTVSLDSVITDKLWTERTLSTQLRDQS